MKVRPGCPTCGQTWRGSRPRVTRGRIVRVPAPKRVRTSRLSLTGRRFYYLNARGKGVPGSSVRVRWPIRREVHGANVADCPDPYHVRRRARPGDPEVYAGLNRHAAPKERKDRRKTKARRHRVRQGKGRR